MLIFGLKTCDTCRKALKALDSATLVDVRETPLDRAFLEAAHGSFGDAVLNTRSTTWRGLDAAERERPVVDLLLAYPPLMKRPLIDADGTLYLGWTKATQAALGLGD